MENKETLQAFYKRIDCTKQESETTLPHINIFERRACSVQIPYTRRDYYKVTLIIGRGKVKYADQSIVIDRPALMFTNPLIPYAWEPQDVPQGGWFCVFNDAFVKQQDRLLSGLPMFQPGNRHIYFLTEDQVQNISELYVRMLKEKRQCYKYKTDVLRSYLHLIIHEGLKMQPENVWKTSVTAATRITHLFLELLERQFPVDYLQNSLKLTTAKDYASRLSVHVNHLNRSVKEVTGKTTTTHIGNRMILEAQSLLQHSDLTVSEIAYSLGFEYPAHFTNFYKRKTGYTPASLRRKIV